MIQRIFKCTFDDYSKNSIGNHLLQDPDYSRFRAEYLPEYYQYTYSDSETIYFIAYRRKLYKFFDFLSVPMVKLADNSFISAMYSDLQFQVLMIEPQVSNITIDDGNEDFLSYNDIIKNVQPCETNIIDLTSERLLQDFDKNVKTRINKFDREKPGQILIISENISDENLKEWHQTLLKLSDNKHISLPEYEYFKNILSNPGKLKPILCTAYKDNSIVGGYFSICASDTVYLLYGGIVNISNSADKSIFTSYMRYKFILKCKELGYKYLDQWGGTIDPQYKESIYYNLGQFKKQFGGKFVRYGEKYIVYKINMLFVKYPIKFMKMLRLI